MMTSKENMHIDTSRATVDEGRFFGFCKDANVASSHNLPSLLYQPTVGSRFHINRRGTGHMPLHDLDRRHRIIGAAPRVMEC